jgi:membrane protease YdiL (CAAX protease family)
MVERHLEFYEGYDQTSAWERTLHTLLFGRRSEVENRAVAVYREVLAHFKTNPEEATPWGLLNTKARLLVTLAELGRTRELRQELNKLSSHPEEAVIGDAISFAYGQTEHQEMPPMVFSGLNLLPLGWAADHLRIRIAKKTDDWPGYQASRQRLKARGHRWRTRTLALTASVATLFVMGMWVLVGGRALSQPSPWPQGILANPWPLRNGLAVLASAVLLGAFLTIVFGLVPGSFFQPGILSLWSNLLVALPMLWMVHLYLLKPKGFNLLSAFGFTLKGVGLLRIATISLAVLVVEWSGTMLMAWGSWQLGTEAHWSQGLYERMIFGPWETTTLSAVSLVLWAPIVEEIGFRGLAYVTLRTRLRPFPAAFLSAVLFSSLHFYSLPGFLSIFWSGLVLAFVFEKFRSLLPGIAIHMAGNLLALSTILLFYR